LPRFSARRSIPAHAVELKKYRCGIEPRSSTCDNKHTAASLGHAEILGVKDTPRDCSFRSRHITSVRPSLPCRLEWHIFPSKPSEKASKSVIRGVENAGYVFPHGDGGFVSNGIKGIKDVNVGEGKLSTVVLQRLSESCN
jgi:hypothetical protein